MKHRYNKYLLRCHALNSWRDSPSTLFLSGALWLALVPGNLSFALASIYAFSRPLRRGEYYRALPEEEKGAAAGGGGGGATGRRRLFGEHGQQLSGLELVGHLLKGLFLGYGGGRQSIIVLPSKPPSKSLFEAVLYQWLEGIPLDAPTHRDLTAAVQRALDEAAS